MIVFSMLMACRSDAVEFNQYYKDLTLHISNKQFIEDFKDSNIDTFVLNSESIASLYELTGEAMRDSILINKMNKLCHTHNIDIRTQEGNYIFVFLYHMYLNGKAPNVEYAKLKAPKMIHKILILETKKENELQARLTEIVNKYKIKYKNRDSIYLIFPMRISTENDKKYFQTYLNPFPATLDYRLADDTLKDKGKIIKMAEIDSLSDILLDIKISFKNYPEALIYDESINIGDTLILSLRAFGRPPED